MIRGLFISVLLFLLSCSSNLAPASDADWYLVYVKKLPRSVRIYDATTRIGKKIYFVRYRGKTIHLSEANKLLLENNVEPLYVVKYRHVVKDVNRFYIVPLSKIDNVYEEK